jgi:hypothetical protein
MICGFRSENLTPPASDRERPASMQETIPDATTVQKARHAAKCSLTVQNQAYSGFEILTPDVFLLLFFGLSRLQDTAG